jgi:SP family arabinose:H+ symporter-like MFS transporter
MSIASMTDETPGYSLVHVSLVAAMGGFLFGYDTAVINGANQYLAARFDLSPAQEGFAAASAIVGCIPGALIGGFLSDRLGRKRTLYLCALLFLLSGIGSALPGTFSGFLAARVFAGVAIGICSIVCPVYISECAPAARRGRLGTLFQLGIVVGIFVTLFVNSFIHGLGDEAWNTAQGWRWMFGSEAVPALLFMLLIPGAPESPRWVVRAQTEPERFALLMDPRIRRPLVIAVVLSAVAQFSGINAIMYYSTRILTDAGVGIGTAFAATALVGLVNLLFTLVAVASIDRVGRRPLLLIGLMTQVVSLSAVAWLLTQPSDGVILLSAILVFIAAFALALGPIPWLLSSEIFPLAVRGRAMSVAAFTVWVSCLVVAQAFPVLHDSPAVGPANTFALFAAVSLLGWLFTWRWVPETKGRTLEEIESSWLRTNGK